MRRKERDKKSERNEKKIFLPAEEFLHMKVMLSHWCKMLRIGYVCVYSANCMCGANFSSFMKKIVPKKPVQSVKTLDIIKMVIWMALMQNFYPFLSCECVYVWLKRKKILENRLSHFQIERSIDVYLFCIRVLCAYQNLFFRNVECLRVSSSLSNNSFIHKT